MSATLERDDSRWRIRIDGEATLSTAAVLKALLVEWLAAGKDLELDLAAVEEIDIAALQLLWAVPREAARMGVQLSARLSAVVVQAAGNAGFSGIPGCPVAE